MQNGYSRNTAETLVVASGKAMRDGLFNEFKKEKELENREFVAFAKEYAMAYQAVHRL